MLKNQSPISQKKKSKKRELKRAEIINKITKNKSPQSKLTLTEIKKIRLVDLYGVGPKIEEYLILNGIDDIQKLSNKSLDKMTNKFIDNLPTLKSFTFEMKKHKLEIIIDEAKFMFNQLKNIN